MCFSVQIKQKFVILNFVLNSSDFVIHLQFYQYSGKRIIIFYTSIPFVEDSLMILESSPDPGGLPFRFIIKSIIPRIF